MFERFTDRARHTIVLAQEESAALGHDYIGTEHLLLGLVRQSDGVAGRALAASGVRIEPARAAVEGIVGRGEVTGPAHIPFTPRAKKVLELSLREALQLGHNDIGTGHLLLGLVHEGEGVGCQVLAALGVALPAVDAQVRILVGAEPPPQMIEQAARRRFRLLRRPGQLVTPEPTPFDQELPVVRRFTPDARRVILLAESEALRLGRPGVGEVHLLLGLLAEGEGGGARALAAVGVTLDAARARAEPSPGRQPRQAPLLPPVIDALELALVEAVNRGRHDIDTEDILLGLVHRADDGAGEAPALFAALGTTPDAVRAAVAGDSEG